jgi:hypothetical protein
LASGRSQGKAPGFAQFGLAPHQPVRQPDRVGHQVRRFVAGEAEHQALVAGAERAVGMHHALVDLDRLVVEAHLHFAATGVDAGCGIRVARIAQHLAGDACGAVMDRVEHGFVDGTEFAGNNDEVVGDQGFAGHLGRRLARQEGVEDRVRDLVGQLVRMALGDRLGSE